jgi:hypothetical protein
MHKDEFYTTATLWSWKGAKMDVPKEGRENLLNKFIQKRLTSQNPTRKKRSRRKPNF